MVIALYMFALAMIVGGAAVVGQGYAIILNERGWTMVIAGTILAASGFVLLGIAYVAARVGRLERALVQLRDRSPHLDAGTVASRPEAAAVIGANVTPSELPPLVERRDEPAVARDEPPEHAVMRSADLIPEPSRQDELLDYTALTPATPERAPPSRPEPPPPEPSPPEPQRTIVGTYNSGGNTYVMFSDGSIEADTPGGRFHFSSLDELKEFIAAGGEEAAARA